MTKASERIQDWEDRIQANSAGWMVRCFEEQESTMNAARNLAAELKPNQSGLVLTRKQTQGRGRQGRVWESPREGFFGTFLLSPKVKIESLPPFTLVVGLTLAEVLEESGAKFVLKWPNDLLSSARKKVAGILVEHTGGVGAGYLLVGIGVNLNGAPKSIPNCTSLAEEFGITQSAPEIAIKLIEQLSSALSKFEEKGFRAFRRGWEQRSFELGEILSVHAGNIVKNGAYQGVTEGGALVLSVDGQVEEILSGEVQCF